jgi:hypothetical protein
MSEMLYVKGYFPDPAHQKQLQLCSSSTTHTNQHLKYIY